MKIGRNVALSTCAALVAAAALASDEEGLAAFEAPDAEYRRALASTLMAAGLAAEGAPASEKFYSSAVKVADSLVGLDPSYENLLLLGQAHLATETYDQALSTFRRAISIDPGHWRAHHALGEVLTHQSRYRAAHKALRTALRLAVDSDEKVIWGSLGNLYWQRKQYARAEQAWEKAGRFAAAARMRALVPRGNFGVGTREVNHPRQKGPAWLPHGSPAPVPVDG